MDYKEAKERGEEVKCKLPPINVRPDDNGQYDVLRGWHRIESAREAELATIQAFIFQGSEADAFVFAASDNSGHGVQMTRGDVRFCIEKAVPLLPDKTPGVIAEMLGYSPSYVAEIINELSASGNLPVQERRKGKDGKSYPSRRKRKVKGKSTTKPPKVDGSGKPGGNPVFDPPSAVPLEKSDDSLMPDQTNGVALEETPEQSDAPATDNVADNGNGVIQTQAPDICIVSVSGDGIPDGADALFDLEEHKVSEKSEQEQVQEFVAIKLIPFAGTKGSKRHTLLCRSLVDWLKCNKSGAWLSSNSIRKNDYTFNPHAEENKPITSASIEEEAHDRDVSHFDFGEIRKPAKTIAERKEDAIASLKKLIDDMNISEGKGLVEEVRHWCNDNSDSLDERQRQRMSSFQ
jgi:hypothetical protein